MAVKKKFWSYPTNTTSSTTFLWKQGNVGCYEYHFLTKGMDKSCFFVVQVVLIGKKMYERNRPYR